MVTFSVLIPIYNVEPYLPKCLDSITAQTYNNLQILCINDGSTDSCLEILKRYKTKDSRIEIINQANHGYGAAVNTGLKNATGDYLSIIEPDDHLDLRAYEIFADEIAHYPQADIIKFSYWHFNDSTPTNISASNSDELNLPYSTFRITRYPQLLLYHPSIWSCVYKESFIRNNLINFIEAPNAGWTDNPFFIKTMCLAKQILWRNHKVYFYREGHPNASSNLKDCRIPILRMLNVLDFIDEYSICDFGILLCIYKRVFSYINIVRENTYYKETEIEPLIHELLKRLDDNVVFTEFFSEQEKEIRKGRVDL